MMRYSRHRADPAAAGGSDISPGVVSMSSRPFIRRTVTSSWPAGVKTTSPGYMPDIVTPRNQPSSYSTNIAKLVAADLLENLCASKS